MAFVQGRHAPRRRTPAPAPAVAPVAAGAPAGAPPNPFGGGRQAGPAPKDFTQPGLRNPLGGPPGFASPAQPPGQGGFARPDTAIPLPAAGGVPQPFGGAAGGGLTNPFAGGRTVLPTPPIFGGGLQRRQFQNFDPRFRGGLQQRQFANPFGR